MKERINKKLRDDLKFFYRLKFKTTTKFAKHLGVSKTRAATVINKDSERVLTLLRYALECDTIANAKITDQNDNIVAELDSKDALEISKFIGSTTRKLVLLECPILQNYAKKVNLEPGVLLSTLKALSIPSIDKLCVLLEGLNCNLDITIKKCN